MSTPTRRTPSPSSPMEPGCWAWATSARKRPCPSWKEKPLLYKYLGGVDAVPICLDTEEPDEFITAVKLLQPSFGGINTKDIAQPKMLPHPGAAASRNGDSRLAR